SFDTVRARSPATRACVRFVNPVAQVRTCGRLGVHGRRESVGRTTRAVVIALCVSLCVATSLDVSGAPVAAQVQTPAQSAQPSAAILTVISGNVLMRSAGADFSTATDGAVLYVGSTIRTGADARAIITLFEGSTVELEPASDITIEEATLRSGSTIVELAQSLGRSWHVVTHLTTADSRYEVKTPAATASVRGTAFEVAVTPGARVRMQDGTIVVTLPNVPDGVFATTVEGSAGAPARVVTTVSDRGEEPVTVESSAQTGAPSATSGVELRGSSDKPSVR